LAAIKAQNDKQSEGKQKQKNQPFVSLAGVVLNMHPGRKRPKKRNKR
jgi:hypothetical protein